MMRRWLALGAYAVLVYGLLPYGPALGKAAQQSMLGRWVLGSGAGWIIAAGVVAVLLRLRRRDAPRAAYALALATATAYGLALLWLKAIRLERIHLLEYGIASLLAWRALVPSSGDRWLTYAGAAVLAALIGWGDELVQSVTPGRYYDLRDVKANAVGAGLGALVVAVCRAGASPTTGESRS
jgi:hypothetical protein